MRFVDTNIILRHIVDDLPEQSYASTELWLAVESGQERVATSQLVIFEAVFTLQRFYRLSLPQVRDRLIPIIELPGLALENKQWFERAFALAIDKNISFPDAFNAVFMEFNRIAELYSWDRHFDRIDGITRIEPGAPSQE